MSATDPATEFRELQALLEQRLAVIADTSLRDADPDAHLDQLKRVSVALNELHGSLKAKGAVPPRLDHFLTQCSYAKALDFVAEKLQS